MPMPYRSDDAHAARRSAAPVRAEVPGQVVSTGADIVFVESPARLLIEQLSSRLDPPSAPDDGRWPGAVRVAVIIGGALALWTLIGTAALIA